MPCVQVASRLHTDFFQSSFLSLKAVTITSLVEELKVRAVKSLIYDIL